MTSQIDRLSSNLQEIYHVITTPQDVFKKSYIDPIDTNKVNEIELPLTSNISGTKVYDSRTGWGRLWRWFYTIAELISRKPIKQQKLILALIKTHNLFHDEIKIHLVALAKYQSYLQECGKGNSYDEGEYFAARKSITQWNQLTSPLIKLLKSDGENPLVKLFQTTFAKAVTAHPELLPKANDGHLFYPESAEKLINIQPLIDLEGLVKGPLPLHQFRNILKGRKLSTEDVVILEEFIKSINNLKPAPINLVHKALKTISSQFNKKKKNPCNVYDLEIYLINKGCNIFFLDDPDHVKWRDELKKGDQVTLANQTFTIVEELLPPSKPMNKKRVFTLKEKKHLVLVVAQNPSIAGIDYHRTKVKKGEKVYVAQIKAVEKDGKFALCERLYPVKMPLWTSDNGILNKTDIRPFNTLVNMFKVLINHDLTPIDLSVDKLMIDNKNIFKHLKKPQFAPFDFILVEKLVLDCSNGNATIFQQLMLQSTLTQHKAAKYFKAVFKEAIKTEPIDLQVLRGLHQIINEKVIIASMKLSVDANALFNILLTDLKTHHTYKELSLDEIERIFIKTYHNTCYISHLSPHFEELFYKNLESSKQSTSKKKKSKCSPS